MALEKRYAGDVQPGPDRRIRIGVNWSVLVIVALLTYGLAAGQFPASAPGRPRGEYVVTALVTAVAYLGSRLAHEVDSGRRC